MNWFIRSSADPAKTAATVKALLLAVAPVLMFLFGVTKDEVDSVIDAIQMVVLFGLSLASSVWFFFGVLRKIYNRRWSARDF